jgi:chromosomal replication initiation ATPase DnaA
MNEEVLRSAMLRGKHTPFPKVAPPLNIPAEKITESDVVIETLQARVKQLERIVGRIVNELGIKVCDNIQTFPTIRGIISATARYFEIPALDIIGHARATAIVHPRQVAMYLAKRLTLHSYPVIAKAFDGRDHTTVMHAVNKVEANRVVDAQLDQALVYLSRELVELKNTPSLQESA